VSLAHERLYVSEREGTADLGDYLRDLARQLELSYSGDPREPMEAAKIAVDVPSLETPVDFCVDVGLIVTELVINAYMHAAGKDGKVRLAISASIEENRLRLVVADDGPGFPADFRPEKSDGLGFRVVTSIAKQRRGSVTLLPGDAGRVVVLLTIAESNR
jgi:two-component sensor histidine kinase